MATAIKLGKRKRGRPSKKISKGMPINELIVSAAREVCCEKGVPGLTVERILNKAGISRPTFYKFFKNKDEVLDLISKDVNQKLINSIIRIFREQAPDEVGLESAIDAYLQWGMTEGAIVGRLYQAMNGEPRLVAENRQAAMNMLIGVFQSAIKVTGRPEKDPLLLDVLIYAVEHMCNPLFTKEHSEEYYNRVRGIVLDLFRKLILSD